MNNKYNFINKSFLEKEYVLRRLTDLELSSELGCSPGLIKNRRKLYNIAPNKGKNLLHQKFEKLFVVKEAGRNRWGQILWHCICDCGKEKIVHGRNLEKKDSKSCGCLKNRTGENNPRWKGYKKISGSFWLHVKHKAKIRNLQWDLKIEQAYDILEKQNFKCYFSGINIDNNNFSLDRIDSSLGYTFDNIVWVHKDVNIMKWEFSVNYFLNLCYLVFSKPEAENYVENIVEFSKHKNWKGYGNISAKYWGILQRSSKSIKRGKNRNLPFELKIEDIWQLFKNQNGKCAISGIPLIFPKTSNEKSLQTASLDRIDSSLGYISNNVWWVHKNINKMKFNFTNEYFILLCTKIVNYHNYKLNKNEIEALWLNI